MSPAGHCMQLAPLRTPWPPSGVGQTCRRLDRVLLGCACWEGRIPRRPHAPGHQQAQYSKSRHWDSFRCCAATQAAGRPARAAGVPDAARRGAGQRRRGGAVRRRPRVRAGAHCASCLIIQSRRSLLQVHQPPCLLGFCKLAIGARLLAPVHHLPRWTTVAGATRLLCPCCGF